MKRLAVVWLMMVLGLMVGCGAGGSYGYGRSPGYLSESDSANGMTYAEVLESPIQDTQQEALSTFSLDVDTASYTRMRRALAEGRLPDEASVRIEEYINFFRWNEPHADTDAPFSVALETAPSPFGEQGSRLLRVGVHAADVPAEQRPAANLVFLVDTSGSMSAPNKLPLVRFALTTLLNALQPTDTVGIVTYASGAGVLLEPTPISERGRLIEAISSLGAGGSTNGEGGIRSAYDLAAQHFVSGGINRVILASDGDFNVGLTGDALIALIERYRDRDITLTTLGFGTGNDREMERLADHGNGAYAFLDSRREALRVLQENLAGTLQVVAKDVKVQVEFDPSVVASFRLIGYDNRILDHHEFEDDSVDAGEVGSGQFVTAYYEYSLVPGVQVAEAGQLATVRIRYKNADDDESQLLEFETDPAPHHADFARATPAFRFGAAVAEYAEILRHSQFSRDTRFSEVRQIAASAMAEQSRDALEFLALVERAAELTEQRD